MSYTPFCRSEDALLAGYTGRLGGSKLPLCNASVGTCTITRNVIQ